MSTSLSYYFSNQSAFPFPGWFDELTEAAQILEKANPFLHALLVEPDRKENHATMKGAPPHLYGNYFIGEGTVIYNDVTIIGPVYIGKGVEIMPGAVIRPGTIISDKCSVGHGSEIKHSVLFGGAKVASLAFVGDSVLGKSARIGSGVITANRKFDQTKATIKIEGEKIDLGTDFFGCILGDYTRLGANSVTQPGTHIGPHTWIFPMTGVRGFIPREKRVFMEQRIDMTENEIVELKP
ncbi:MAG: hypothetical protein FWC72_07275 [Oscillospiraceae bacterium]|nr:hypothetical protein [Oscillospiraceae bacterium]